MPSWLVVVLCVVGLAWVAFGVLCVAAVGRNGKKTAASPSSATRWAPYAEHDARERAIANRNAELGCKLTIPGTDGAVPVFPTEEGMDEFSSAAGRHDHRAQMVALGANGAAIVPSGTACAYLDRGVMRSKVRILDGERVGFAGWVPSEWTH